MTPAQKFKFYFPAWNDAVAANQWRMEQKRLVIAENRLTDEGRKIVALARQRAALNQRGPVLDDLRHAAHIFALGKDKSSEALTNQETDKVVTLFRLLTDPEDLDAVMAWQAYQRGDDPGAHKRIEWFITHAAPDEYTRAIAADKFGTRQWENLGIGEKRNLATTLANRKKPVAASRQTAAKSEPPGAHGVTRPTDDPDWTV